MNLTGDIMDFERVDMREMTEEEMIKAGEMAEIVFKLNHTLPNTDEKVPEPLLPLITLLQLKVPICRLFSMVTVPSGKPKNPPHTTPRVSPLMEPSKIQSVMCN